MLGDLQSAIRVATAKLGLQPGAAFQARVTQLGELVTAHKLVSATVLCSLKGNHGPVVNYC